MQLKHGFTLNGSDFFNVKRRGLFCGDDTDYSVFMTDLTDDTKAQSAIAERIRQAIASKPRGIKVKIADKCGVKPQAITGWEKLGKIDKSHLAVVADETGYSLGWLITGKGEKLKASPAVDIDPVSDYISRAVRLARAVIVEDGGNFTEDQQFFIFRSCVDVNKSIHISDDDLKEKIRKILELV